MLKNVGGVDRKARLVGGLILFVVAFFSPDITVLKILLYTLATIGLVTGIVCVCPVNILCGVNTAKAPKP